MTLQIAAVGTNGIIIGSDRLIRNTEPEVDAKTLTYHGSKIFRDKARGIVACWSGDNPSMKFAKNVVGLPNEDIQNPSSLEKLANEIFSEESEKLGFAYRDGEVILAMSRALDKIYHIRVQRESIWQSISTRVIAGNTSVVSVYFAERFYRKGLTMEQLTPLIAHTILDAGRTKDSGVEGLEIVYCSEAGLMDVEPDQIFQLEKMSESLEAKVINNLMPNTL
jgi:hypothetical protein